MTAILFPYLATPMSAGPEDIDRGMELGRAHPMGPLRLLDLIGHRAQAVAEPT